MTILFLCSGNIHRSAHAEALLRERARRDGRTDLTIRSAGVVAVDGMAAVGEAVQVAGEAGIDLGSHRSSPATAATLADAEQILVMESFHIEWLALNHPDCAPRARLLTEYGSATMRSLGVEPGQDLPDAIGGDRESFRRSFAILQECVLRLYEALPPAPQEVYAAAIESRFRALRRVPMTLSPADYALVERWWGEGVPLWIVVGALDDLSRRREASGESARVRRLSYCESEVEERFAAHQRSRLGADEDSAADGTGPDRLDRAAALLLEAARAASERGLQKAASIYLEMSRRAVPDSRQDGASAAAVGLRLHEMDEELMARLRGLVSPEAMTSWRELAASQLSGFRDRMTAGAYQATVERLVAEHMREHFAVPPLSGA